MKKIFAFITTLVLAITLVGCSQGDMTNTNESLSSDQAIASLSYLSAGFLSTSETDTTASNTLAFLAEHETTEVESELDNINIYVDKLLAFMDGAEQFGNIEEEASDRAEFDHKMTITVDDDTYVLYYSVDAETGGITGILIVDDVEYTVVATNNLEDKDEFDDDDDEADTDDDDDDEEETEEEMTLVATNGDDTITITYKAESDEEEVETEFVMVKNIDGVESEVELQIKEEEDEYKIEIEEDNKSYEFKRETEEEGLVYKLEYEVNGVEGEIKIIVTENEAGETIYTYEIEEEGKETKEIEKEDPDDDDDDEDTEDDEDTTA